MSENPRPYLVNRENKASKRNWKSGKTTTIRVPEKFAHRLLLIARQWDEENYNSADERK